MAFDLANTQVAGLKVTRSQLSSYIHECLARQPYVYHTCFFPDWEIKINWVEQKLIRCGKKERRKKDEEH